MGVMTMRSTFQGTKELFSNEESLEPLQFYNSRRKKITLNISGVRFETYESTLERFPNTLLGNRNKRARFYNSVNREFYFPRDNTAFDLILFFYQSNGMLVKPSEEFVPDDVFRREVVFYELGQAAQKQLPVTYNKEFNKNTFGSAENSVQRIRFLLEHPAKSLHGKILGVWVMFIMTLSVAIRCMKTLPIFHQIHSLSCDINSTFSSAPIGLSRNDYYHIWLSFEVFCSGNFALEYFARLLTVIEKRRYIFSALGIIDFICFVPSFALLIDYIYLFTPDLNSLRNLLEFLPFLCIFKVSRYSVGLELFWKSLHSSSNELGLLLYCVLLSVIFFGSLLFYCEDGLNNFTSIPASFWYAIITMTTVGYGDMVAASLAGKFFSACCAVIGVTSLLALPTTVVVNNFNDFYKSRKSKLNQCTKQFKDEKDWDIEPDL